MQNYTFSSKLPRKKQEICKSSAKSPEICEIPSEQVKICVICEICVPPLPMTAIDQKNCGNLLEYQEIRKKSCYFILILLLIFINFISRYTIYMEYIMYLCTKVEPFKQIQL